MAQARVHVFEIATQWHVACCEDREKWQDGLPGARYV